MIIGDGNIAKVLTDRDDLTFFACGVSDSSCVDESQYNREYILLLQQDKGKHIVYFSNLATYYKNDRYTRHKIFMEDCIKNNFVSYTIVRIEVCEWVSNPTTILNVFKRKIKDKEDIQVRDEYRYVLSLDEFLYWIGLIKVGVKNEMNILGTRYKVKDIVKLIKKGKL